MQSRDDEAWEPDKTYGENTSVTRLLCSGRLLVFFSVIPRFLSAVAERLQRQYPSMKLSGVALGRPHRRTALASGAAWESIAIFSDAIREYGLDQPADLTFLHEMETAYGRPNLYSMTEADWYIRDYPHQRVCRFLEVVFRFLLREMDRIRPDAIIAEGIDCALSHALYSIARSRRIPYIFPASGRLPGRIALIGNPNDRWEQAEELFADFQRSGVPARHREAAEAFLQDFLDRGPAAPCIRRANRRRFFRSGDLRVFRQVIIAHCADPEDYSSLALAPLLAQRLVRTLRAHAISHHYRQPQPGDRYLLFPLHVQPEATTMTLAPHYVDQPALIANIARSLPVGYVVYVKEHPQALGVRPIEEYRRIARIPNAKLIPTETRVADLLQKSAAVATIAGTMGLEGLMLGLPVITFGKPFYTASELPYEVERPGELPAVFQRALFHHIPDRQKLISFLAAALAGSYPGQIGYEDVSPPESFSEENMGLVAKAFELELARQLSEPGTGAAQSAASVASVS